MATALQGSSKDSNSAQKEAEAKDKATKQQYIYQESRRDR